MLSALLLLGVTVIHAPQLLAFPYEQRIGTVTVYAERPIDPRIASELARAEGLWRTGAPSAAPTRCPA